MGYSVVIGGERFSEDAILDGRLGLSNSLPCDELATDTMSAKVDGSAMRGTRFLPKGASGMYTRDDKLFCVRPYLRVLVRDPTRYSYGEPVYYYRGERLVAKFYMSRARRVGPYSYEIRCVSAVGLLDDSDHYGGIYQGEPLSEVLADIIGGVVPYSLDPSLAGINIYNWLPIKSRRVNLQQLLFAVGVSVLKDENGDLRFAALNEEDPAELPDDRVFLGGDVDYGSPITSAEISEHAYIAYDSDSVSVLFEGEVPADSVTTPQGTVVPGVLVRFNGPMHGLSIENGTILEQGVNYAVLGPSAACKLSGMAYTHTVRVVTASKPTATRGLVDIKDNVARVTDATLVSLANSENVAKRVLAYYGYAKTVSEDVVVDAERPGMPLRYSDPYDGAQAEGFIKALDLSISGLTRASAKLVSGYVPTGIGNFYTQSVLLTRPTRFVIPLGVHKIRVVLISGGSGGYSGGQGVKGEGSFSDRTMKKGGPGGAGGPGAAGGQIYVATIPVAPGQTFEFTPGLGGLGGVSAGVEPIAGKSGGATTFGAYSSAGGKASDKGYTDIFGKGTFGILGRAGNAGAKGSGSEGSGPSIEVDGVIYSAGASGSTQSDYRGTGQGGAGGGAGYGANGLPGGDGDTFTQANGSYAAQGGRGGVGGTGKSEQGATGYGNGGHGGHGGGGGGAGGGASSSSGQNYSFGGDGGDGGLGGQGGRGAPGCGLIYF